MSHLYKKYDSYSDYLAAKNNGEFDGITYSIATFPNSNEVDVYFLKEANETNYAYYISGSEYDHPISYWTANKGQKITEFVNRFINTKLVEAVFQVSTT